MSDDYRALRMDIGAFFRQNPARKKEVVVLSVKWTSYRANIQYRINIVDFPGQGHNILPCIFAEFP
jgi:hypothetical protein